MAEKKDGGHAFPNITPDMNVDGGPGMTLRDWFAGQALAGLCASDGFTKRLGDREENFLGRADSEAAGCAYEMADAMLEARDAD